ncbi:MAG TPA: hypothetical protein VGV18_01250 [Verrucomicrobiae bacterium]|nr:hypothetical protein [Verrucomicrobiae bacterium]
MGIVFAKRDTAYCIFKMTNKGDYLNALESAIRMRHKCIATHRETVFVLAKTEDGETVWEGLVEEFNLSGHVTARICYVWRHAEPNGRSKIITVLHNKFIDSAEKAVQAAIFTDAQPPARRFSTDLKSLAIQIRECKELIYRMGIKSEDLSASVDSAQQIKESIWRKQSQGF